MGYLDGFRNKKNDLGANKHTHESMGNLWMARNEIKEQRQGGIPNGQIRKQKMRDHGGFMTGSRTRDGNCKVADKLIIIINNTRSIHLVRIRCVFLVSFLCSYSHAVNTQNK